MALIVQKFGGTSVANIERIKKICQIILSENQKGNKLVIVVSAMAGVTNALISQCSQVSNLNNCDHLQEYDAIVGSGEILTSGLVALELQRIGLNAKSLQAWQIPILTDNIFSNAKVESIGTDFLNNLINDNIIPVITGFQGVTYNGQITTLGKGGSDTSAALIGAALSANRVDIYTDVTGVFSADPRIVHEASKIDEISTKMMVELSAYGAKVLHPRAALAAYRYNFDMRIISSFEDNIGTLITSKSDNEINNMENKLITAITSNKNLLQIEIKIFAHQFDSIIKTFAHEGMVAEKIEIQNSTIINLIANLSDKNKFENILENLKNSSKILNYSIKSNISTVTIVGYGIKNDNGFSFEIIDLLAQNQIQTKGIDSTEIRLTILLEDQDTEIAIKLLHNYCNLELK